MHLSTNVDSSTNTKKILLVRKNSTKKKKIVFARQFHTIYEQKFSNLIPLLFITFPPRFCESKKLGHWTFGSGGKMTVKRSEKSQY